MTAELTSIKVAFEEAGMSPQEIADDRGLDPAAVKAALMQSSTLYRRACGVAGEDDSDGINFTKDEARRVKAVMLDLAISAENEHLRAKMATTVYDDYRGRREIRQALAGNTFNILAINEGIQKARQLAESKVKQLLNGHEKKAINV